MAAKMSRKASDVFLLLAAILAYVFCPSPVWADGYSTENPIHVAAILPLTGDYAALGGATKNGTQMALGELSEEERAKFVVTFEDDAQQSIRALSAVRKLEQSNRIDVVVVLGSNIRSCITYQHSRDQIPDIVIARNQRKAFSLSLVTWRSGAQRRPEQACL
jgi:hypothetical protein